jgi:hypothetical protein
MEVGSRNIVSSRNRFIVDNFLKGTAIEVVWNRFAWVKQPVKHEFNRFRTGFLFPKSAEI